MKQTNNTVLITGAASGIGRATALAFARAGANLVLCDLDGGRLDETAAEVAALGARVLARRADVACWEAIDALAAESNATFGAADVLVNNAGVVVAGDFLDTALEDWDWILRINLWGAIHVCRAFLPAMQARGQGGHIVNVCSVAGYLAAGYATAYSTSKFAIFGLSEALRGELHAHRIGVSTVCPAVVDTQIMENARLRGGVNLPGVPAQLRAMFKERGYSSDKVAESILRAVQQRSAVVPVSPEAWAMYLLNRLSPLFAFSINRFVTSRGQQRIAKQFT